MNQTKLTREQKQELREMRLHSPEVTVVHNGRVTIAFQSDSTVTEFSTAVCSDGEDKFRRKVGEFIARRRLMDDRFCILPNDDFSELTGTYS